MNLYLIKAKIIKRVYGISGPFENIEGRLVNAETTSEAKRKFEQSIQTSASNMECESINFEYIEVIPEIK